METFSGKTGIKGGVESKIGGRQENQDSYGMSDTRMGMLVVVCDGMGGGPAGKTASTIAVQAIIDYVSGTAAEKNPVYVLEEAGVAANEALLAAVEANPSLKGMGTTCVCLLITHDKAYVMHIGDSRCYQLRDGKAVFRTADHSYVGELVRRGTITEEEARNSKYSNVITRAIGVSPEIIPEVDELNYKPGDRFALMSDGIWGAMSEPQLVVLLCSNEPPVDLVTDLSERVEAIGNNSGGGHDNLTIAVVDIPSAKFKTDAVKTNPVIRQSHNENDDKSKLEESKKVSAGTAESKVKGRPDRSKMLTLIGSLVVLLLIAAGVIGYLLASQGKEDSKTAKAEIPSIEDNRGNPKSGSPNVSKNNQESTSKENSPKAQSGQKISDLNVAMTKLLDLRDYNKDKSSSDYKQIYKAREDIYNDIVRHLTDAKANAEPSKKSHFDKPLNHLKDAEIKRRLLSCKSKDNPSYLSTAESLKEIEVCRSMITQLMRE